RWRRWFGDFGLLAHYHSKFMYATVVSQHDFVFCQNYVVELNAQQATINHMRVFNFDPVQSLTVTVLNLELAPKSRNAGLEFQTITRKFEAKNIFQRRAIHPTG